MEGKTMFAKLKPSLQAAHLRDISLRELGERGIRHILLDMDNTLAPWREETVDGADSAWIENAKAEGFTLLILTNSASRRPGNIAKALGIDFSGNAKKPFRAPLEKLMGQREMRPEDTVLVGDQLFTDILLANKLGLYSVLVKPLSDREWWPTRAFNRSREKLVWRFVFKKEKK